MVDPTGFLYDEAHYPEKRRRDFDPSQMPCPFAFNAIGSALITKHILPLPPFEDKPVFAGLLARGGGIGDNRLRGWYS